MSKAGFYFKLLLYAAIVFLVIKNISYINRQNMWSPIDEFAHMDYIIKVSNGQFPAITDLISPEIIEHVQKEPYRISVMSLTDLQNLGLTARCYEAHHPPVYYLIMSVPNKLLSVFNMDIFTRLKYLRLISFGLYFIGLLMLLPVFKELSKQGYRIPVQYVLGAIIFGLLVATHQRYGLGNNMVSLLLINLSALFLLRSFRKNYNQNLFVSITFLGLCLLSSYTNIFIAPFIFLAYIIKIIKRITIKNTLISIGIIALFACAYFIWKNLSIPIKSGADFYYLLLNMIIPAGYYNYPFFIELFMKDAFTLSFLHHGLYVRTVFIVMLGINLLISIIFLRSIFKNMKWILFMYLLFFNLIVSSYFLNEYVGGVNWYALRHFTGFIPVLYIVSTSFILIPFNRIKSNH